MIAQANVAFNRAAGTLRGMHFQFPPKRRDEARPLHARRDRRHHRRPAAREPDIPRAHRRRAERGERPRALRARALRARLPGARGRHRDELQVGEFYAPETEGGLRLRRPAARPRLAAAGRGDLGEGPQWRHCSTRSSPRCGGGWRSPSPEEAAMIIVDTRAAERAKRRAPDPGRHGRRRVHGPGPHQPDRQQRPGHAHGRRDLQPAARAGRATCTATRGWRSRHGRRPGRARGRDPRRTRPSSPTTRCCSAAAEQIDVVVDVTGSVEFGAHVVLEAFAPRQARRADERRDRRDDRADPAGLRGAARRDHVGLRRRRARPADEPRTAG